MHRLCIQGCWLLLQGGCEDITCGDLDRKSVGKSVEAPKCMTMGPSIHHELILALDQTDLNGGFSLAEEELPWITDVARCQVGTRWGRATPRWHRAALPSGPRWPCHIHLLLWSMFVTILAKICHISCIQIILQVQVELGEI